VLPQPDSEKRGLSTWEYALKTAGMLPTFTPLTDADPALASTVEFVDLSVMTCVGADWPEVDA
jgi:hypothetical protein